jgi:hypothetical protein
MSLFQTNDIPQVSIQDQKVASKMTPYISLFRKTAFINPNPKVSSETMPSLIPRNGPSIYNSPFLAGKERYNSPFLYMSS